MALDTLEDMTVLPICITGEPVLHQVAEPVVDFDDALSTLVADMFETMEAAPGVGLAAPQIGIGRRLFVYDWTDADGTRTRGVAANPELWISPPPIGIPDEDEEEGCLSIPGYRWDCRRHLHVVASGWTMHGDPIQVEGSQMLARAIQHETDHLDGVLFVDRLDAEARAAALAALEAAEWAGVPSYLPVPEPVVKVSPH